MSVWSHIIIEGYCMFKSMSKKNHKFLTSEQLAKSLSDPKYKPDYEVKVNEAYIPKSERPKWCSVKNKKLIPEYKCLCKGGKNRDVLLCPFFAFANASKSDYKCIDKKYSDKK